jgi:hypothetical protein
MDMRVRHNGLGSEWSTTRKLSRTVQNGVVRVRHSESAAFIRGGLLHFIEGLPWRPNVVLRVYCISMTGPDSKRIPDRVQLT